MDTFDVEICSQRMFLLKVVLPTLVLVSSTTGGAITSPNSRSGADQYRERESKGVPSRASAARTKALSGSVDATDRTHQMGPDAGILLRTLTNQKPETAIDSNQRYASNLPTDQHDHRLKRSYYPYQSNYQIQWPQFDSLNTWKANFYPIQRPYFVPIYGYDGRIPLYYPQITYVKPPYVGPTYLPPVGPTYLPPTSTTTSAPPTNNTTKMPIDDRFGDNDDDDRPIWDNGNGGYYPNPTTPKSSITPTRKPMASTSTFPPLVHNTDSTKTTNQLSSDENEVATVSPAIPRPQGPSKCVWAIVSCCSTGSKEVSYECFDQLGCGGPFWDVNPCDTEYAKAAIQTALNYYNSRF